MRRLTSVVLTVLIVIAATVGSASAQDTTATPQAVTLYELALRDGSRLYGDVVRQDNVEVVFRTQGGTTLTVARTEILSLLRVSGIINGEEFEPADPNQTRLFFGPTGRSLKRGQTYLGVYEFGLPFVQVGITDRISVGGGTPLFFGEGESSRPFWITPKVQLIGTRPPRSPSESSTALRDRGIKEGLRMSWGRTATPPRRSRLAPAWRTPRGTVAERRS